MRARARAHCEREISRGHLIPDMWIFFPSVVNVFWVLNWLCHDNYDDLGQAFPCL